MSTPEFPHTSLSGSPHLTTNHQSLGRPHILTPHIITHIHTHHHHTHHYTHTHILVGGGSTAWSQLNASRPHHNAVATFLLISTQLPTIYHPSATTSSIQLDPTREKGRGSLPPSLTIHGADRSEGPGLLHVGHTLPHVVDWVVVLHRGQVLGSFPR